ncbi:CK088 protein, partial [Penelope pileata]|nr:CK088 protein [Penelope pileata]
MERGHQDTAPRSPVSTEPGQHPAAPDGPLVFAGSSPVDVEHARIFWGSAMLPPLRESSLGLISQRRERTFPEQPRSPQQPPLQPSTSPGLSEARNTQKAEEKEKYLQQAKKREEILALLRKHREERVAVSLTS